ncbi:hypothetical protein [Hymenobacter sp. BT491]|uniref:hypothetical protein n=1 Tax=Hymenobacter sp. BT491 TaxID=2766779 RepID=UPI0016539AEC|nr:hypothetical protein [Hymenobacter sp. BT491]MBC6991231.1 hypothetical protein [Hymenobacter sp. BT491]
MKSLRWLLFCLLASCSVSNQEEAEEQQSAATDTVAWAERPELPKERVIKKITRTHFFSNRISPDLFRLQLVGDSVLSGTFHLSIVSAAGTRLWDDEFPAAAFLDDKLSAAAADPPTVAQREAYVLRRMSKVFDKQHFKDPGVRKHDTFEPGLDSNEAVWLEVQSQHLISFTYCQYAEVCKTIAYIPQRRKVMLFEACCE